MSFVDVTRSIVGRLLRRRLAVVGLPPAAATVDVPIVDFRRGILEGDGGTGRGAVAGFIDERRRLGGIVVALIELSVGDGFGRVCNIKT